ncbi:MAG: cytochrome c oxidase subunit II [Nocardiopsaceae bacterium]|nr:cytochrome c oxidase subunit II [Nocardiopsaceae bacterium]
MTSGTTGTPAAPPAPGAGGREPRHWLRLFVMWFVLSLAADLITWYVWRPHLPPGDMSTSATGQQFDFAVLAVTGFPVVIAVLLYFAYAIVAWRAGPDDEGDGPPIHGHTKVSVTWIITTSLIVLWAFAFGTFELIVPAGAGSGEGPNPVWNLAGKTSSTWAPGQGDKLQVQVIGQQWAWTFRYPQFGGMESSKLYLPTGTPIEFHVTSLDVIHSFWAYQLGVKADANPGVDDVAYTTVHQKGTFEVRCNELCGIWHGAMYTYGNAVSPARFASWATSVRGKEAKDGLLRALPKYALTYDPTVISAIGKNLPKIDGITGAAGYYYPPSDPVTP